MELAAARNTLALKHTYIKEKNADKLGAIARAVTTVWGVFVLQMKTTHWSSAMNTVAQWKGGKKRKRWDSDTNKTQPTSVPPPPFFSYVLSSSFYTETNHLDSDLLQASAFLMLAETEEWLSRIRLRGTCQVVCAYVRCRQIEMFAQSRASFSLCVSTFLSSLHPGEVLRESEVVLHDLFTPVENQGIRTFVTLMGLCK